MMINISPVSVTDAVLAIVLVWLILRMKRHA